MKRKATCVDFCSFFLLKFIYKFKHKLLYAVGSSRNQAKKSAFFFFFFHDERKQEWCRTLTLEKIKRWNHNEILNV